MFGRGKSKQALGSIGFSQRLEEDRISQLPDHLICQILSHLPTKDIVKTSVLSTRWRSLWLWVPRLKLDSQDFPDLTAFVSFGESFFDSSRVLCIDKLKLIIDDGNGTYLYHSWIDAAAKRKIQHLRIRSYLYEIPISLYICETLVVWFPNDATFESLVSSCSVLEELKIKGRHVNSYAKVFRVLSRSLKSLTISLLFSLRTGIVIDAPQLRLLSICDNLSESFIVTNMDPNVKLDLYLASDFVFEVADLSSNIKRLRSFLPQILKVKDMIIRQETFKLICEYLKLELPQFGYMSRLQVALYYSHSKWLPTSLESFTNLKYLILVCYGDYEKMPSEGMNQFNFSHAPLCLISSLEFVDIRFPYSGLAAEMKLVRYLLENSAILKKITLYLSSHSTEDEIFEKLFKIPRASTKCEVVIV